MDLPTVDASQPKAIRMAGSPVLDDERTTDASEEPFFSTLDIILLGALLLAALWWLMRRNKQEEYVPTTKSYTIQPTSFTALTPSENSFIKKLKSSGRSLVVFYGSQTGTGEEFAGRLAKEGIRYKMKGMVADPEECDMEELIHLKTIPNSLAVFCLATYGEGDPTDNAMEFVDWLKNGDADLNGLNYAVFGLGNKTYEHYNEVAIYVDHRLEQLGATRVVELGLGDDDANIEDDFITWKDKFWPLVCEFFGIEGAGEDVSIRQYKLTEHVDVPAERIYTGELARLHSFKNQRPPFDAKNPYLAPVKINRELHGPTSERSCMHIEFDIEGSKMRYEAGDHLAVYPVNSADLVNKIGEKCGANLDTVFTLTNTDEESTKKHPFPCPCTYRTALTHYLDITGNPRTHILKELAEYATDPADKEKLKLMASTSAEGKAAYQQWIVQENRNIVHILEDVPSLKPALDHLCEILPRLQCRYYSISSSPKLHPTSIHITAVVVEYKTPTGRINKGVTTSWLKEKHPSDPPCLVPIFVRKSQFRLPTRMSTPIVMVGPGTGLAPFRGFIQERDLARREGKEVGDTILYFGCRKSCEDYLYREELEEFVKNGTLTLHCAFSRDQPEKVYVTHLLEKNKEELWRVIGEKNGHIYICGDARNMARDVHNILIKVVMERGNMSELDATAYIKKMDSQKRYSSDNDSWFASPFDFEPKRNAKPPVKRTHSQTLKSDLSDEYSRYSIFKKESNANSLSTWLAACEPKKRSELAVSRQKQQEISTWLETKVQQRLPSILVVSGPAGCGKTVAVKVLAKDNGYNVIEWITPIDQAMDENNRIMRQGEVFEDFLIRSTRYTSILTGGSRQLLLVKDLPNAYLRDKESFFLLIERYFQMGKEPVAFICTETGNSRLLQTLFPPEIQQKFDISLINVNSVTQAAMKNALKRSSEILNSTAGRYINVSQCEIDEILSNSIGDIRGAVLNLIFISLKVPEKLSRSEKESSGRDESIGLLHTIGRVINPKRVVDGDSWRFAYNPDDIAILFQSQASTFISFLQENYLNTVGQIEDVTMGADTLSLSDILNSEWRDTRLSRVTLSFCIRGIMVGNEKPVSGWNPVRKPHSDRPDMQRRLCTAEVRWYESIINPAGSKTKAELPNTEFEGHIE